MMALLFCFIIMVPILPALTFADSVFQENLAPPRLDVESGKVVLTYNIVSSKQEADGATHTYLKIDLLTNSTSHERRKAVTYNLVFTNAADASNRPILNEVFYTENGTLLLDIIHSSPPITIPGTREQLLNSYIADPSGKITVRGFPFEGGVTYHVHVMILTVDNIRNLFESGKEPTTDFVFSGDMPSAVGEVRVVPEFPYATLMLATSIATIIALSSKIVDRVKRAKTFYK